MTHTLWFWRLVAFTLATEVVPIVGAGFDGSFLYLGAAFLHDRSQCTDSVATPLLAEPDSRGLLATHARVALPYKDTVFSAVFLQEKS